MCMYVKDVSARLAKLLLLEVIMLLLLLLLLLLAQPPPLTPMIVRSMLCAGATRFSPRISRFTPPPSSIPVLVRHILRAL